jgi:hypothetical protein
MRNAIELAWNRGEKELGDIFGYKALSMEDKPTNGEFISRIAKEALSKRSLNSCSVPFLSGCII